MSFPLPPNCLQHTHPIFQAVDKLGLFMLGKFRNRWARDGLFVAAKYMRKQGFPLEITLRATRALWPLILRT